MTARYPLYLDIADGLTQIWTLSDAEDLNIDTLHQFAGYAYAYDPNPKLEVNTGNGTQMPNQNFTDTYYIAGTSTTRVDRFATESETPNISMSTDTYNRIRIIDDNPTLPTTDANNLEYPLYLDADYNLQAMTRQDFIDSFVTPVLDNWATASTTDISAGGTYFLTTSTTPTNASLVSTTPVAVNGVANLAAYTAGGIGETLKQTTDVNYYLAITGADPTLYDVYDAEVDEYSLPLYFDAGTETIRSHTPTSWAQLLGPFLRYYLGGGDAARTISYNIDGTGTTMGTTYVDERRTPSGVDYNTRFVNANDYRTQEFPTGTVGTVAGSQKELKRKVGP